MGVQPLDPPAANTSVPPAATPPSRESLPRPELATPSSFALITQQLQQLADTNEALQHELTRRYDHLNVVLELSENCSSFESPAEIEAALLSRYAVTLDVSALLLDRGDRHGPAVIGRTRSGLPAAGQLQERLAAEIELVRRTRHTCRLDRPEARRRGLGDFHVLLSALHGNREHPGVVIALRGGQQPPFDDNDRLASETVLVYGGHMLCNVQMVQRLQQASLETVGALANAIEARDNYTRGHSERVSYLAALTGRALGLSADELQMLEWAGLLHDVGKIGIPERILNKPGELEPAEFEQIKRHPWLGYEVLRPVSSLKAVLDAVLYHHENHDGSGYPDGLCGDQIPLPAQILHVVDIFDALTSSRSYRAGLAVEEALSVLADGMHRITEPKITMAFIRAFGHYVQTEPKDFEQRFAHV